MSVFRTHAIGRPAFLGSSWRDSSRDTDPCPHATLPLTPDASVDVPVVAFWVHEPDPTNRTGRYRVVLRHASSGDATLWMGNDEAAASAWAHAAEIAASIATEITADADLSRARSFAELHDYCDANCLGDQEAFLDACGWTGNDDASDELALVASTEVLNNAQTIVDHWLRTR